MKGVIADPDVQELYLQDRDEFIIMACDGLWDVMQVIPCRPACV